MHDVAGGFSKAQEVGKRRIPAVNPRYPFHISYLGGVDHDAHESGRAGGSLDSIVDVRGCLWP